MAGTLAPNPVFTGFDSNGDPLASGKLTTYAAGTSTLLATYSDVDLTVANANPIILNAAGRAVIFLSAASYKFVLTTSADVAVWTQDNISAVPATNLDLDIVATAGEALTANRAVYISAGDGGRTAGRWYMADADLIYASTGAEAIGMVTTDLAVGEIGTVRRAGRATGLSGLTAGTVYYISATAGAITSTAPQNARAVGVADSSTSLVFGEVRNRAVRRISTVIATVGNVGAGEDTLHEYVASAGQLNVNEMSYEGTFYGLTANNANVKTLRVRIIEGANNNAIITFVPTASEAGYWVLQFWILRESATVARSSALATVGPANGPVSRSGTANAVGMTATWANAVTIRLTGEATTDNDITLTGGTLKIVP